MNNESIEVIFADEKVRGAFWKQGSAGSAGHDLCALIKNPVTLKPNESILISTGVRVWLRDPELCGFVYPRSGLGCKGVVLKNLVGVIDSDYQGEIKVCLWNTSNSKVVIDPLERVAQYVIQRVVASKEKFNEVERFSDETVRGDKGFGSSGSR